MFYLKLYRVSLFIILLLVSASVRADYRLESIDGCVVEIKDWSTMSTELINLKAIARFKYNETEGNASLTYLGMMKAFTIAKLKKAQASNLKNAYANCTQ